MPAITASMIAELRARTDASMTDCRNALTEADGDVSRAEQLLRGKQIRGRESRSALSDALAEFPGFEDGYRAARRQEEFGRRLRALREERNLTQSALAELAKVDQGDISRFEAGKWGKRGISFEILERILPVLGLKLEHRVLPADDQLASDRSREAVEVMSGLL